MLIVDEVDEYAYLQQEENSSLPHLVQRYPLSYPLSMLLVGSSLGNIKLSKAIRDKSMLLIAAERFVIAPVITYLVMLLICPDPMLRNIMVITAATPSAIIITALSLQNGLDGEYPSEGILVTTLLSMITLPITVYLIL